MTVLPVLSGALVGAPTGSPADRAPAHRFDSVLPLDTLAVNIFGSAAPDASIGAAANRRLFPTVGIGLRGALTMFSTFGYETARPAGEGACSYAVANVVSGVGASVAADRSGSRPGQRVRS